MIGILFLWRADFKQSPPNIPSPNINIRKRRHGEEEIYYIPVRNFPSCVFIYDYLQNVMPYITGYLQLVYKALTIKSNQNELFPGFRFVAGKTLSC